MRVLPGSNRLAATALSATALAPALALACAIVVAGLAGCAKDPGKAFGKSSRDGGGRGGSNGATRAQAVRVEALVVRPQLLRNTISTTGTLLANEEVEIRSEISGRVTGVFFEEGKQVHKGDLLLRINDSELRAELKRREAEEKQAASDEARKRELFQTQAISQDEYDKVVNALRMVQADREALESRLAQTEIRAPFDGTIGLRSISDGGYVTPDLVIASMQDVNTMKVEFAAPEKYVGQLASGTAVVVRVSESAQAYPGVVYAADSRIDSGTRTIKFRARIPHAGGALVPGSFAKVEVTLQEIPDAIVVPSGAVIPDISGESVIVCRAGKAGVVPVKTGIRTDRGTQITSGLAAGDTLVLTGLLQLTDGKPVLVQSLRTD